jgi:hypothetical protein
MVGYAYIDPEAVDQFGDTIGRTLYVLYLDSKANY